MVFSAPLSEKMANIIDSISDNFEENLQRHFHQEGSRYFYKEELDIPLGMFFVKTETYDITLSNVKIAKRPEFKIDRLRSDLKKLNINWKLNLGNLEVNGDYLETSCVEPKQIAGKFKMNLLDLTCEGNSGLFIRSDSFRTENYDLKYNYSEEVLRCVVKGDEKLITKFDLSSIAGLWPEIKLQLTEMFNRQLVAVIVEYSVSETLIDEPEDLKTMCSEQIKRANGLIETLKKAGALLVRNEKMDKSPLPSLAYSFIIPTSENSIGESSGNFQVPLGEIENMDSFSRSGDFSALETEDYLVIYGNLSLQSFKYVLENFKLEEGPIKAGGNLKVDQTYRNTIFLKLEFLKGKGGVKGAVEEVQVAVNSTEVERSGVERGEDEAAGQIEVHVLGYTKNKVLPMVESRVRKGFAHAVETANITDIFTN